MSTGTRSRVKVTTATAVTFVNNELMSGFMSIAQSADADVHWLVNNRERLTEALSSWLEEQALACVELQVVGEDGELKEAYVFDVSYDGGSGYVEFPVEEVKAEVSRYNSDVSVLINPITYENERSSDYGFTFSEEYTARRKPLTSFGAGHIKVDVGKVTDYGRNEIGMGQTVAILSAFGLIGALMYLTWVVLTGVFFEILAFVIGGNFLLDLWMAISLLLIIFVFFGVYIDSLSGIRIYAAIPALVFLYTVNFVLPLSFVEPFGLSNFALWVAFLLVVFIALEELSQS